MKEKTENDTIDSYDDFLNGVAQSARMSEEVVEEMGAVDSQEGLGFKRVAVVRGGTHTATQG